MRHLILLAVFILGVCNLFAQAPGSFKYQALIRDSNGEVLAEQNVAMRISIIQGSTSGTILYSERHTSNTNRNGLINLIIGQGTPLSGTFSSIPWGNDLFFLKLEMDPEGGNNYTEMGTSQLLSVPYALYSKQSKTVDHYSSDTLFVVKDKQGNVVFAVFPDGAKVYVNDTVNKDKAGGFAVSGRSKVKGTEYNIFHTTPDSTRIFINEYTGNKDKAGGFAVSGRSKVKGEENKLFYTDNDSTRIYIDNSTRDKAGGFAVSGRSKIKNMSDNYFNVSGSNTVDTINPSKPMILWYPKKEAFLTGRVLIEGPDSVGTNSMATGFESKAVGDYSQAMGYQALSRNDYTTAIGHQPIATGQYSVAIGKNSKATDKSAYAFGEYARAKGYKSYALGYMCSATGLKSYCIGSQNDARGETSIAIGHRADANGNSAVAMGRNSQAIGYHSIAIGISDDSFGGWTTASGSKSIAIGTSSESNQYASFTYGFDLENNDNYSVVLGKYNEPLTSGTSLIVGNGTSSSRSNAMIVYENGDVEIAGNLNENSDIRLKNNIKSIGSSLKKINNLNPVYFNFKNKTFYPGGKQVGLIAQEVEKIFPEFVSSDEKGFLSVNYSKMSVILIKAIQEQNKIIKRLDKENKDLNKKFDKILQMINKK
jgi:hypothetical protein